MVELEQHERITEELYDLKPDIHPLSVRFTDPHQWVIELKTLMEILKLSSKPFR